MTIEAKVIADSISPAGKRITTLQLRYPRFIHAEFMTHRVFSRNASSSRAIPVAKMIEQVRNDPAMPIHWGKNQPGMQAKEELTGADLEKAKLLWVESAKWAATIAEQMVTCGLHKQVANRILEPFQHIHVVVTATEFDNFFALRAHPDAQPEIHELAIQMHAAMNVSTPKLLQLGEWHLPYVTEMDQSAAFALYGRNDEAWALLRKVSGARCARVSYLKHDGERPAIEDDLELYSQLVVRPYTDKRGNVLTLGDPIHASPIEHQATPDTESDRYSAEGELVGVGWDNFYLHGNFVGWIQARKLVESSL